MLELLAPAGSPEAVVAAVQNGADSIYLGFGDYNARRNAVNFTEDDLKLACEYCRIRGVKVYVTLNTLATDRELVLVERMAKNANRAGVDAILVQDLGVMRAIKQAVPDMPIHASTQMSVHSLDGVKAVAELGASRAVLARELSRDNIKYICDNSPIEIEAFVHGALCMCYSGQCYMSSIIGKRSGNRGLCAQPCRLGYNLDGISGNHLSLKDYCLAYDIEELRNIGVKCIKIEGRMKRPEYTAIVTGVYANAIKEGRRPSEEEMRLLAMAFSRQGFTNAYFKGEKGPKMLGVRTEDNKQEFAFFSQVKKEYMKSERQRVPVKLYFMAKYGYPARLAAEDEDGNVAKVEGAMPERAFNRQLEQSELEDRLSKTGGTPYYISETKCAIDNGLNIPASEINALRRAALEILTDLRGKREPQREGIYRAGAQVANDERAPVLNIQISELNQISDDLLSLGLGIIYMPLEKITNGGVAVDKILRAAGEVVPVLPRVITDSQTEEIVGLLEKAKSMGINQVLTGNIGHIELAESQGFDVRGDFGLNIFNSQGLKTLKNMELLSATLSFELNGAQIRDISKSLNCEIIAYGRLPLMVTENNIVTNTKKNFAWDRPVSLSDRKGAAFPIIREYGDRNVILNSQKLFLADRLSNFQSIGLWGLRLLFTTENARECYDVTRRYMSLGSYEPGGFTRGLYYRGVQ